jgi:hypothetical protein
MTEREGCTLLKARFERAGFHVAENYALNETGLQFELDGFDAERRVGYEFVTEEAGDGWDVDDRVRAELAARAKRGELFVLVVDEADAPDAPALTAAADRFLATVAARAAEPAPAPAKPKKPPAKPKAGAGKPAAKASAAKKTKK